MNAVLLGSAFSEPVLAGERLEAVPVPTPWGSVTVWEHPSGGLVVFRHGVPHRFLPHQVPWRGHAWALRERGCTALLVTSSVGVLDPSLPLYEPLVLSDLLMPANRLPDGSACTVFDVPRAGQGHLVVVDGLFSRGLSAQIDAWLEAPAPRAVFAYVGGPRTKTAAENRWWTAQGAQVNSMSVGPEVVLANELELSVAGVVIGHKYSVAGRRDPLGHSAIADSLVASRHALERLAARFLAQAVPVPFGNRIHRLG